MGERQDVTFQNPSFAFVPNATWNARPGCDRRTTNIEHFTCWPPIVA